MKLSLRGPGFAILFSSSVPIELQLFDIDSKVVRSISIFP